MRSEFHNPSGLAALRRGSMGADLISQNRRASSMLAGETFTTMSQSGYSQGMRFSPPNITAFKERPLGD